MSLGNITALLDKAFGNSLIPGMPVAREVEHRVSSRTYDTATGLATRAETVHQRPAIIMNYSAREIADSGGLIRQGDRLALLRPVPGLPVPRIDDRLLFDSKSFQILAIDDAAVGDARLVFRCQCREGG